MLTRRRRRMARVSVVQLPALRGRQLPKNFLIRAPHQASPAPDLIVPHGGVPYSVATGNPINFEQQMSCGRRNQMGLSMLTRTGPNV